MVVTARKAMERVNGVLWDIFKTYHASYKKVSHTPEYLPMHVGPLSGHTHSVYTKPPAEVGFGNAFARSWDAADDIKKMAMVGVASNLEKMDARYASNSPMRWPARTAAGWLNSVKSIAPRVHTPGTGTVIPDHFDRYGMDLLHPTNPHKRQR